VSHGGINNRARLEPGLGGEWDPWDAEDESEEPWISLPTGPCIPLMPAPPGSPIVTGVRGWRAWAAWSQTIWNYRFEHEPIGRYARSLRRLPRALWHQPLEQFIAEPLHKMRARPWFGPKRLAVLSEILRDLAGTLATRPVAQAEGLRVRSVELADVERRLLDELQPRRAPRILELQRFVIPRLMDQLERDAGPLARQLFDARLCPDSTAARTYTEHAAGLGITRARYYQLLRTGREALRLRWPEGPAFWRVLAVRAGPMADRIDQPWCVPDLFGDFD
jgi:hypothetical protein